MSATFKITVNSVRTATVANLPNVVKQVDWTMEGEESGQKFALPQTTTLSDPEQSSFVPFEQLTEPQVVEWIEATDERIPLIKAHIQMVLDKEVQKAGLSSANLPWAPVVEPAPTVG